MRSVTLQAIRLFYFLTGNERFAYIAALILVTVMNVSVFGGTSFLLEDMLPLGIIHRFWLFPFNIGTAILIACLNVYLVPFKMVSAIYQMPAKYFYLIIYFGVAVLLFTYFNMLGKIF